MHRSSNPNVVEVKNVTDGSLDGETIPSQWNSINKDTIRVYINAEGVDGISGSGYLAKMGFELTGGDESALELSNGVLYNNEAAEIIANWANATLKVVGAEEDEEEEEEEKEVSEEFKPGSPKIMAFKPADAVVARYYRRGQR